MNKIKQNIENGILAVAKKNLRCDGLVKFNEIEKNKENGVQCVGINNFSRIISNLSIGSNRRAGVKVMEGASVTISKNHIKSNFG